MKNWIFLGMVFVILLGCKEDLVLVDPIPPVKSVTIIATVVGSGGTISPLGSTSVKTGESVTYNIKPDAGYNILSIKVDGIDISISDLYQFTNVSSNRTISVVFISNEQMFFDNVTFILIAEELDLGNGVWIPNINVPVYQLVFNLNGTGRVYLNRKDTYQFKWSLSKDMKTLIFDGRVFTILVLNKTTLQYTEVLLVQGHVTRRQTYKAQ